MFSSTGYRSVAQGRFSTAIGPGTSASSMGETSMGFFCKLSILLVLLQLIDCQQ